MEETPREMQLTTILTTARSCTMLARLLRSDRVWRRHAHLKCQQAKLRQSTFAGQNPCAQVGQAKTLAFQPTSVSMLRLATKLSSSTQMAGKFPDITTKREMWCSPGFIR